MRPLREERGLVQNSPDSIGDGFKILLRERRGRVQNYPKEVAAANAIRGAVWENERGTYFYKFNFLMF